jgi:hypothetical protein
MPNTTAIAFCPIVETNRKDAAQATVKAVPCSMTISVPPPDNATITTVANAPTLTNTMARTAAKTTGILRRLKNESVKMEKGIRGKTAINHSSQVAFGRDGSVSGIGTKPSATMAAPMSAAYLWAVEIIHVLRRPA